MRNQVHIVVHCRQCDNRLEAYADNLSITLRNLDQMKVEIATHMRDNACIMPAPENIKDETNG